MNGRLYGFFCELRRRKVYRVAAAYAVVGWLLIQISATIFPIFGLPQWSLKLIIIGILIGFPIALILSWAFDVGPHGIHKATAASGENCPPALRPKSRNIFVLGAVGVVIAAAAGFFILPRTSARALEKSIAVLPFDNFSENIENEHFGDGIQDDLLTSLAKIGDLKVISRTSVMPYKGRTHNIKEIGRALGVGAILEGSVRREGNRVRVNVQLIDTRTDEHLWAEIYDRDITDVFAIQSALSRDIAAKLKARLSPNESSRISTKPTENSEAYLLYVQAHALSANPDLTERAKAKDLLERAIALDPQFALAHAQLSHLHSRTYYASDPTPVRLEKARTEAEEAMRLQPDLPESHLALGFFYYYGGREYEKALAEFEIARRDLPNDANVFRAIGAIERRQGKWKESAQHYQEAIARSPNDSILVENAGMTYLAMRDYSAAEKAFDRAIGLAPASYEMKSLRGWVDVHTKKDFTRLNSLLSELSKTRDPSPVATLIKFNALFFQRQFQPALQALAQSPFENMTGETSAPLPKSFLAAQIYRAMGDSKSARAAYEEARAVAERAVTESPNDAARHVLLGLVYAALDRKDEALQSAMRATEILPETKDAFDGPIISLAAARIYAAVGEQDEAITRLEKSLTTPGGTTLNEARLDPSWDVLRSNPRFQKLLAL